MKWERKKSPGLSFLPVSSWLSKLKEMRGRNQTRPAKTKQNTKPRSPSSSSVPVCFRPSRLSNGGFGVNSVSSSRSPEILDRKTGRNLIGCVKPEDAFWRFSFRKRSFDCKEKGGGRDEDELEFQLSSPSSCGLDGREVGNGFDREFPESQRFSDLLSGIRKRRSSSAKSEISPENQRPLIAKDSRSANQKSSKAGGRIREDEHLMSYRQSGHHGKRSPKREQRISKLHRAEIYRHEIASPRPRPSDRRISDENHKLRSMNPRKSDGGIRRKDEKLIPLLISNSKPEKGQTVGDPHLPSEKQSIRNRDLQRRKFSTKIGVHSPRTASKMEICKIKALEDLKKKNKRIKGKEKEGGLESFAVVKCSFNPQKDFRDSMVEMIEENGIGRPEELESLLASYLSLNSEEYHDLIVKVFRQVWFDLNRPCLAFEYKQKQHHYT